MNEIEQALGRDYKNLQIYGTVIRDAEKAKVAGQHLDSASEHPDPDARRVKVAIFLQNHIYMTISYPEVVLLNIPSPDTVIYTRLAKYILHGQPCREFGFPGAHKERNCQCGRIMLQTLEHLESRSDSRVEGSCIFVEEITDESRRTVKHGRPMKL